MATYIKDLKELAVGIEDEDLVFATLRQQDVIFHHKSDRTAITRLRIVEVLKNRPFAEEMGELAEG